MFSKIIECQTVTPMFISGADGKHAELRAPSIKGLLRYWWRAANYDADIKSLYAKESAIFGGTGTDPDSEDKAAKSKFSLRLILPEKIETSTGDLPRHILNYTNSKNRTIPINLLNYLAFGAVTMVDRQVTIREYIQPGFKFQLAVQSADQSAINEVLKYLYILSYFGGIGSKSRNGFGSFQINFPEGSTSINIKDLFNTNIIGQPKYPAFSKSSTLWEFKDNYPSWDTAIEKMAKIYRAVRLNLEPKYTLKKRGLLAAPLIIPRGGNQSPVERRGKSYFMSIHKITDNKFTGRILLLDSGFSTDPKVSGFEKEYQDVVKSVNDYFNSSSELKRVI